MTKRRRRKQYDEAVRRETVRAWRQSGESAEAFAARTGIGKSNLWRWSARYATEGAGSATAIGRRPANGFAAVQVVADASLRAEVPGQALMCELDGPFGLRLRVYQGADVAALRLLLVLPLTPVDGHLVTTFDGHRGVIEFRQTAMPIAT